MIALTGEKFHEVYRDIVALICDDTMTDTRLCHGTRTVDLGPTSFTLTSTGTDNGCFVARGRRTNMRYLAAELIWYYTADNRASSIAPYAKLWDRIKDERGRLESAYGYHIFGGWGPFLDQDARSPWTACINRIIKDRYTRQAVIPIYGRKHIMRDHLDTPCTLGIGFSLRQGHHGLDVLDMNVIMRSNDVWYGLTYDVPFFLSLQKQMTRAIAWSTNTMIMHGNYTHTSFSTHAYTRDMDKIQTMSQGSFSMDTDVPLFTKQIVDSQGHYNPHPDISHWLDEQIGE